MGEICDNLRYNWAALIGFTMIGIYFIILFFKWWMNRYYFEGAYDIFVNEKHPWRLIRMWKQLEQVYKHDDHVQFKYASSDMSVVKYVWGSRTLISWKDGSMSIYIDGKKCETCGHNHALLLANGRQLPLSNRIAEYLFDKHYTAICNAKKIQDMGYYTDGLHN